jgi:site-specific recombinase XerD
MQHTLTADTTTLSLPFAEMLAGFARDLISRDLAATTQLAYTTDVRQFLTYLEGTTITADRPEKITKADITEYLSSLAEQGVAGVTRRRKLAAVREFFRYLAGAGVITVSPAAEIRLPKKEVKARVYLRVDEFQRLVAAAGGHPRDYCILQLFLQLGLRVSELVNLRVSDVDLTERVVIVRNGKGGKDRAIPLEKRSYTALKTYLSFRRDNPCPSLFLSYQGQGISDRGVKKLVEKYRRRAGIEKKISCHSLRHSFGVYKAEQGVSPWRLQEWFGHSNLQTTQIYTHMGSRQNGRKVMEQTSLPT